MSCSRPDSWDAWSTDSAVPGSSRKTPLTRCSASVSSMRPWSTSWQAIRNAAPAPGSLRLIQALVNTWNAETGRDLLGTASEASQWLVAAGLLPDRLALTAVQRAALVERAQILAVASQEW